MKKDKSEKKIIKEPYGEIDLTMFKEFTEADGISGFEKEASRVMKKWMEGYVDDIQYDNLGSIIGVKKGNGSGRKLMLAGHIDEIGFVIKEIDDNVLRYEPLNAIYSLDGLHFYDSYFRHYKDVMGEKFFMAFEINYDQKGKLTKLIKQYFDLNNTQYIFKRDMLSNSTCHKRRSIGSGIKRY